MLISQSSNWVTAANYLAAVTQLLQQLIRTDIRERCNAVPTIIAICFLRGVIVI